MKSIITCAATAVMLISNGVMAAEVNPAKTITAGSAINSEVKDKIRSSMDKAKEANKEKRERAKALTQEMEQIMRADSFDKEAYLAKARERQNLHNEVSISRQEAMANVASTLTKEERITMLENKKKRKENKQKHK